MSDAPLRGRVFEEYVIRLVARAKTIDSLAFILDKIDQEQALWSEADPEAAAHIATTRKHVEAKLAELVAERQGHERQMAAHANSIERDRLRRAGGLHANLEKNDALELAKACAEIGARIKKLESQPAEPRGFYQTTLVAKKISSGGLNG